MIKDGITFAGAEGVYGMAFRPDDQYFIALYTDKANLDENTSKYVAAGEASGQGYAPGGKALSPPRIVMDGKCVIWDFDDLTWPNSSIDACCALIYNKTRNRSLAVLSFEPKTSRNGNFRVAMPAPNAQEGVVRFYF